MPLFCIDALGSSPLSQEGDLKPPAAVGSSVENAQGEFTKLSELPGNKYVSVRIYAQLYV